MAGLASSPRMLERQCSFSFTCSGSLSFSLYLEEDGGERGNDVKQF